MKVRREIRKSVAATNIIYGESPLLRWTVECRSVRPSTVTYTVADRRLTLRDVCKIMEYLDLPDVRARD